MVKYRFSFERIENPNKINIATSANKHITRTGNRMDAVIIVESSMAFAWIASVTYRGLIK